jgi:hypothetical protein
VGCACDDGSCLADDAYCDGDLCQLANCLLGREGCPCQEGACDTAEDGSRLFCEESICRREACEPGEAGCACAGGASCDAGRRCANGTCVLDGCTPGTQLCTCAGGACNGGLRCRTDNVCVEGRGQRNEMCYDDGTCDRGNQCVSDYCVPCTLGVPGCACTDTDTCFVGAACMGGLCVAESELVPEVPTDFRCYTPCASGAVIDGDYRSCGPDGLMDGCVGGRSCRDGSCLLEDQEAAGCTTELDCSFFQTCIASLCFSECENADDCPSGLGCDDHVCRQRCDTDVNLCPARHSCVIDDGNNGHCHPNQPEGGAPMTEVAGNFELSVAALTFTSSEPVATFQIVNDSPIAREFSVRKSAHTLRFADGSGSTAVRRNDGAVVDCEGNSCACDVDADCVDDQDRCVNNACRPTQCTERTCPMFWVELGERDGDGERVEEFVVNLDAGRALTVEIGAAGETSAVRWEGSLTIANEDLGEQTIELLYNEIPEGRWAGEMVYLGQFGTRGLDEWAQGDRDDLTRLEQVGNALIQRWGALRRGRISWREFEAVLTATESGSWNYQNVRDNCRGEACYLYDIGVLGTAVYSNDLDSVPVPTGAAQLPFAMNLRIPDSEGAPEALVGRVDSGRALQYAGMPSVSLRFSQDPSGCARTAFGACLVFVEEMEMTALVGGRYLTEPGDTGCAAQPDGYTQFRVPWLVGGFDGNSYFDADTGRRYVYECRDTQLPFVPGDDDEAEISNLSLAGSNPVPDGRARRRSLRVLDGALVNQSQLFVLFEERFGSFVDGDDDGFSAYGYILLERKAVEFDDDDDDGNGILDLYEGTEHTDNREEPAGVLAPVCDEDLLAGVLPEGDSELTSDNLAEVVSLLVDGLPSRESVRLLDGQDPEQVHYLCADTGLFDGGPGNTARYRGTDVVLNTDDCIRYGEDRSANGVCEDGGPGASFTYCSLGSDYSDCGLRYDDDDDIKVECPEGSEVLYFTVDVDTLTQADIAALDCQLDATCAELLTAWTDAADPLVQYQPAWTCTDEDARYCDTDRTDLRNDKQFYGEDERLPGYLSIRHLTESAFRYETRFQNREGQNIGFTPSICSGEGDLLPYCYDPEEIEQILARIDCLLSIHSTWYDTLDNPDDADLLSARQALDAYLEFNFSFEEEYSTPLGRNVQYDGFERQYAQLLIMLGDEAFTQAAASRFDLGQVNTATFEGSLLEPDGIDLSGAVGYEMLNLYRASQYYQMVLDRFYTHTLALVDALTYGRDNRNFVSANTVIYYFDRVVRASTQRSRSFAEIAKRYQALGQPELARRVAERAYTSSYLESILMNRMMLRIVDVSLDSDQTQVQSAVENGQSRLRASLLEMQDVHSTIRDDLTIFGFDPSYIPFPALDREDFRQSNAFELLLARAQTKVQFAREREEAAINATREFDTNEAQFQAELGQLRNNYEGQLGDVCGTVLVRGRVYPAIRKYAHLRDDLALLGDPCGQVGNGQIHQGIGNLQDLALEAGSLKVSHSNVVEEMEIERQRVSDYCGQLIEFADMVYEERSRIVSIQEDIRETRFVLDQVNRATSSTGSLFQNPIGGLLELGAQAATFSFEQDIIDKENEVAEAEAALSTWEYENQCSLGEIDSEARVATMRLRLKEIAVEALRSANRTQLAIAELERLRNLARRLQIEQTEAEQLQVNVQAAHNNPNVRLYRNDAVINAEIAFDDAIEEVYKLTRVFEYYTSQTYSDRGDLFLTRLVARGDHNLENYLAQLVNTFYDFEELFGHPATRVHAVSLKNDILAIPQLDNEGNPYADSERTALMRAALTDSSRLDKDGYLTLTFSTNLDDVSPLTRNHKILYMQADIYGNDTGDFVGRLYVRSKGTGVIHGVADDTTFFRFDPRTSVMNTKFGGVDYFDPAVYQSYRHRDRPFVNTNWEMVFNQRDERVNQDINLNSLTDVRLYIYYTDVTVF